jgi:hypothetical protein
MKNEPSDEKIRNLLLKNAHCSGTRGHSATSDLLIPLKFQKILSFLIQIFFIYLTIGRAIKNETSHTITIIMATRFEFLCRAYLSGFVTAI